MQLYIARHTKTNYNESGLCNDNPSVDVHLTDEGIKQALELSNKLRDMKFDALFASELPRTQQTAQIINKYHSLPLQIDSRINENHSGFEGQQVSAWFEAVSASKDIWTYRRGDSESLADVQIRVRNFIERLKQQQYSNVCVVTHSVIVRLIQRTLDVEPKGLWDYTVVQGSYDVVHI